MIPDFSNNEIRKLIHDQVNLPSPPVVAAQILNIIQNKESSLDDLEEIISADPALTSKLLRIANSAFYALPQEISNVNRALSILGTNVIKNIALSFVIAKDLSGDPESYFDFEDFWRRSLTTAVAAELVTATLQKKNEDIFVTALLQDIGILTFYLSKGREYTTALKHCAVNGGASLIKMEKETYQFDHQQLGYTLLESWGIPQSILTPLRFHHQPEQAPEAAGEICRVLYVSSLLSTIYSGTETAENVRALQSKMDEFFNLNKEQTRTILDNVASQSLEIFKIFEIDPGKMKPYSQMLQEANDELGKLNLSYEQLVLELKQSKEKSERFANELREANIRLEEMAFRDGLTNLYNHRYFQEMLAIEMARSKRYKYSLCLIMFDIDFFKEVNDTHGHPVGDQVLKNLAHSISKAVRPSDIVARYGGEEFAVILPETSQSGLKVFAERLRRCATNVATIIKGKPVNITISIGGARLSPKHNITQQAFINVADRGLFQSKKNGRNQVTILPVETDIN